MQFDLGSALEILGRTPKTLNALLRDLPDPWVRATEGPDTWSAYDVVGHLIHADETDWIPRARVILDFGPSKPFEPFDRFAQFESSRGKSLDHLLGEFAAVRARSLSELAEMKITPELLNREGRHPEFGPVTLGQLLSTWVVHDLDHLAQVSRVLAKAYGDAVGPWKAYLRVLK